MIMTIDGITALAVIGIASFGIDRMVRGTLFLLSFSPTWRRFFPTPESILDDEPKECPEQTVPRIVLPFAPTWDRSPKQTTPLPAKLRRLRADRRLKLAYYSLAGVLGCVVLAYFGEVRIFRAIGFEQTPDVLDCIFTGLIVTAGSDTIAKLKFPGLSQAATTAPSPLQVTGRLALDDRGKLHSAA
jgi:hypothetical protein